MSNYQDDLKNAESVGKQVFSDYQSGKGLSNDDMQKAGSAAESLVKDYESRNGGQGSNAVESAVSDFSKTSIGRKIEGNVAKQAVKSEAENALKSGNFGSVAGDVESFLNKN